MKTTMRSVRWLTLTAFAVACSDAVTDPAPDPSGISEVAGLADVVIRYEEGMCPGPDTRGKGFLCESRDEESSPRLWVSHYQADDIFFCGGSRLFPMWQVQQWSNPAGTFYHSRLEGAPAFIYDWDELIAAAIGGELCSFIAEGWLYRGSHDMVMNEVVRPDGSYRATWIGTGTVYDVDGNPHKYEEHQAETDEGFSRREVRVH